MEFFSMKTIRAAMCLLSTLCCFSISASSGAQQTTTKGADVEKQIRILHEQMRQAALSGNTIIQEKYVVDDIVGIGPDGKMVTKDQMILMRKSGRVKFGAINERNVKVRVYGDTVIMDAVVSVNETIDGKAYTGEHAATFVFVKQAGAWKEVAFEQTPMLQKR
jgi:hypothetical protein